MVNRLQSTEKVFLLLFFLLFLFVDEAGKLMGWGRRGGRLRAPGRGRAAGGWDCTGYIASGYVFNLLPKKTYTICTSYLAVVRRNLRRPHVKVLVTFAGVVVVPLNTDVFATRNSVFPF